MVDLTATAPNDDPDSSGYSHIEIIATQLSSSTPSSDAIPRNSIRLSNATIKTTLSSTVTRVNPRSIFSFASFALLVCLALIASPFVASTALPNLQSRNVSSHARSPAHGHSSAVDHRPALTFTNANSDLFSTTLTNLTRSVLDVHKRGIVSDEEQIDELLRLLARKRSDMRREARAMAEARSPTPTTLDPTRIWRRATAEPAESTCACKEGKPFPKALAVMIPILVILAGLFAGLTLGYFSLDETQLQVLIAQGTPQQKAYAERIMPVRKDGHLLLSTLLIGNMICSEILPVIAEPILGGGVQAVIVSVVLIVIFSELIPQSICSRYGLVVGAYMATPTRAVMLLFWPVAWPVSRVLHWALGAHHGIVYRRAELKELVNLHAAAGGRGGDLQRDTVMLVGGALDLQEKVVKEAMTPIEKVFMLPFEAKLDYPTLEKVVRSGHSRIPIYKDVQVPANNGLSGSTTPSGKRTGGILTGLRKASLGPIKSNSMDSKDEKGANAATLPPVEMVTRKKIIGTLLVKSCVLLDPEDATPVSALTLNALPTVPGDEPLLNVLNVFQEGRSHMAIVSPRPRINVTSPSQADLSKSQQNLYKSSSAQAGDKKKVDKLGHIREDGDDVEAEAASSSSSSDGTKKESIWRRAFGHSHQAEQELPADAVVVPDEPAPQYTFSGDSELPIGIITLEDVLEELIQEEIFDEYDQEGGHEGAFAGMSPPPSPGPVHSLDKQVSLTVLQRLGLGRGGKTSNPDGSDATPANSFTAEPDAMDSKPVGEKDAVSSATKSAPPLISVTGENTDSGANSRVGSLSRVTSIKSATGAAASTPDSKETSSVKFSADPSRPNDYFSANESAPTVPGQAPMTPATAAQQASAMASTQPVVVPANVAQTPGAGRPVVVRTHTATGQTSIAVVSESLLRGRMPKSASVLAAENASLANSTEGLGASTPRSQTPTGLPSSSTSRGMRFKSTPMPPAQLAGVANAGSAPISRAGSIVRGRSTEPVRSTLAVEMKPDEGSGEEKQEKE